jgi:hypothetical protein
MQDRFAARSWNARIFDYILLEVDQTSTMEIPRLVLDIRERQA